MVHRIAGSNALCAARTSPSSRPQPQFACCWHSLELGVASAHSLLGAPYASWTHCFWSGDSLRLRPSSRRASFSVAVHLQCMQAAFRTAIGRLGEGFSTALVVWAGAPSCPSCAPALHCPEVPRCPDCVCSGGNRVSLPESTTTWTWWLVTFLLGVSCLCAGFAFGVSYGCQTRQR